MTRGESPSRHTPEAIIATRASPSRRQLLQAGSLGLGLSLPDLLRADSAGAGREKSCIFIVQYGGASHAAGGGRLHAAGERGAGRGGAVRVMDG